MLCVLCIKDETERERCSVVSSVVGRNDANYIGESSIISNYMGGQNGLLPIFTFLVGPK